MIFKTFCARMDHGGCGLLVHVEDGKIIKVEGDPDSPSARGYLCAKGLAQVERINHPDRLQFPLKRAGKREKKVGTHLLGRGAPNDSGKDQRDNCQGWGEGCLLCPGNTQGSRTLSDAAPRQSLEYSECLDPWKYLPHAPGNGCKPHLRVLPHSRLRSSACRRRWSGEATSSRPMKKG